MGASVIDPRLQAFLANPVMVVLAAADETGRAALARGMGARVQAGEAAVEVFVSRAQWGGVVRALQSGARVAVTLSRPETYETYQIKGAVTACRSPDDDGLAFAAAYCERISAHLLSLGPLQRHIACWITTEDLVGVHVRVEQLFNQTPGPGAGDLLPQVVR